MWLQQHINHGLYPLSASRYEWGFCLSHVKLKGADPDEVELGYSLMSEEHRPLDLVRFAGLAEDAGFSFATISDHFHPWINATGNSPFVWGTIGGIAVSTKRLRLGTAVTCPTMRIPPAIIAQAAATAAAMMPDRFFLGVGTGENLNEHILGSIWPPHEIRSAMLEEALEIIRKLWRGKNTSYYGNFYVVENARIYTLPETPVPIIIAAEGPKMAQTAGRLGDGLMSTTPDSSFIAAFKKEAGEDELPLYCQASVCYDRDETAAKNTAYQQWPITGVPSSLTWELPTPKFFEQAAVTVTEEQATKNVACGADPKRHLEIIKSYLDAGFKKVAIHNIGPNQEEFFRFYKEKIIPETQKMR
jgi:coenzyme F420-dependent glucose-6-phosphate dehydrogenase